MSSSVPFALLSALALTAAGAAFAQKPTGALISVQAVKVDRHAHKIYAIDQTGDNVVVIDEAKKTTQRVAVGRTPAAIAVNEATGRVYVGNRSDGTLSVIDGATDKVVATIDVGVRPFAVAADPVTNRVYVSNTFNDTMSILDGATNTRTTMKVPGADAMLVDWHGGKLYLTGYEDANLRVLDEATQNFSRVKTGSHNFGIVQNERTGDLWVPLVGSAQLVKLDGATGDRTVTAVGDFPCATAVNPATNRVYVVNYGDETVSVVDGATTKVLATVKVGSHPQAVAVDWKRNRVYVANVHGDSVSEIDGATNSVIATRPAGKNPYALVVSEETGAVYVADMAGEPLTVLPGAAGK